MSYDTLYVPDSTGSVLQLLRSDASRLTWIGSGFRAVHFPQ